MRTASRRAAPLMRLAAALIFVALAVPAAIPAAAQGVVADLPLAGGGSERVLLAASAGPSATLIMLPGGDGVVEIDDRGRITRLARNFLLRTEPLWLAEGFAVAVLGPPDGASLLGRRHTASYAGAIGRAVAFARARIAAPVWLVGTSQGSTAAANGAARLGGRLAGAVLTSSVTRPNNSGETVFDSGLEQIAIPLLIVANDGDTCRATPPADAARIAAALARAPRKEVVYVHSSRLLSAPCQAMSPHGYLGIEAAVVRRIAAWIRATPPR